MCLKKNERKYYITIVLLAIIFLFYFSANTSPLYPNFHGWDSAFFTLVARMINNGKIPYVDIIDHKGPIVFWIYLLGLKIYDGKTGIFVIQTFLFIFSVTFLYKLLRLFIKEPKIALYCTIVCILFFGVTFENGALTEELSLPFIFSSIYFLVKFLLLKKEKHSLVASWWYGISFGSMLLIRITNAGMVCGFIAAVLFCLLYRKQFLEVIKNAVYFLLGFSCIVFPVTVYFFQMGALDDLFFCMFQLAGTYAGDGLSVGLLTKVLRVLIQLVPIIFTMSVCFVYRKIDKTLALCVFFAQMLQTIILLLGSGFMHYYTLVIPGFSIGIGMFIGLLPDDFSIQNLMKKRTYFVPLVLLIITFLYYGSNLIITSGGNFLKMTTRYYMDTYDAIKEQTAIIPKEDRDSVLAYNIRARWYVIGNLQPCYRLACFQEEYVRMIPELDRELKELLAVRPPKWLAVELPNLDCPPLEEMLPKEYELKSEAEGISLYRRIAP